MYSGLNKRIFHHVKKMCLLCKLVNCVKFTAWISDTHHNLAVLFSGNTDLTRLFDGEPEHLTSQTLLESDMFLVAGKKVMYRNKRKSNLK